MHAHYRLGDQAFYWRGTGCSRSAWATRWHGPAVVIGFDGNNVWLQHRSTTVKAGMRHLRPAEIEEQIPWASLLGEPPEDAAQQNPSPALPEGIDGDPHMDRAYLDLTLGRTAAARAQVSPPRGGTHCQA